MAKSRSRGASRKAAPKRQPSATSRKKAPAGGAGASTEIEVVEEAPGMGVDGGIAVITCIVLVVACVLLDAQLGKYGAGMFFK